MIEALKKKINLLDEHTLEVLKKSASSAVVKIGGMIAGLIVSISLGRLLGPDKFGIIALTNMVVRFLLIILMLGTEQFLIKQSAIGYANKDWKTINDWMKSAYILNGTFTLVVSIILIIFAPFIAKNVFHDGRLETPLIITFIFLIPQVTTTIVATGLVGFKKIWQSNLSNETLSSVVVGIGLILAYLLGLNLSVNLVSFIYGISALCVAVVMHIYWRRLFKYSGEFTNKIKILYKNSRPFFIVSISGIVLVYADGILLGLLANTREIGLYNIAAKLAIMTSFFLQVTNSSVSPKIASLYASGKISEIQKMVHQVTKYFIIIGIAPVIIFAVWGRFILGIWGHGFSDAYWILFVLSLGQFINMATGSAGNLLIMTGNEKVHAKITGVFVGINLCLNVILILKIGALGAAFATAITIAGENVTKMCIAYKKTSVLTMPIKLKAKYNT